MRIVSRENIGASTLLVEQICLKMLVSKLQDEISSCISTLTLTSPRATASLTQAIEPALMNFRKKVLVHPGLGPGAPQANYTVDFLRTYRDAACGHMHQVTVELCFDNRQAIGTNLLKAQMANKLLPTLNGNSSIAVLVVADSVIKSRAYDSSVGDEGEYESALLGAYAAELTTPIILFTLT